MCAQVIHNDIEALESITLLYVEDDSFAREEIAYFLESKVKRLYVAENGQEGLERFLQHQDEVDIIVTDIQMPKMNGLDMAVKIKSYVHDIPVVITSAHNDSDFLFRAIEAGIDHYITKPLDLMLLVEKLGKIARHIRAQKQLRQAQKSLENYQKAIDKSLLLTKHDLFGKITYVNDRLCSLTGYAKEMLYGKEESFLWADKAENGLTYAQFFTQLQSEGYVQTTVSYTTRSEHPLIVDLTAFVVKDENGNPEGYLFVRKDITELFNYRKLLERRLNLKQNNLDEKIHFLNQYQKALDLGTALCRIDCSGKIIYVNETFAMLLDVQIDDFVGKNYFGLFCFEDGLGGMGKLQQSIDKNDLYTSSVRYKNSAGKNIYLNSFYIPIFDLEQNVLEIVCIHYDLTDVIELNREINDTQRELIFTLGEVAEGRSNETGNHIKRVSEYTALLASYCGYSQKEIETVKIASTMHDIGKIAIEDAILKKPDRLTREEYLRMKEHSLIGYNMFKNSKRPILKAASIIAKEHHEKWDGSGYPYGLKGEEIHHYGRMVALVDVFDALISDRAYKKGWDSEKVFAFLEAQKGKHFDPELVEIFLGHFYEFIAIKETYHD